MPCSCDPRVFEWNTGYPRSLSHVALCRVWERRSGAGRTIRCMCAGPEPKSGQCGRSKRITSPSPPQGDAWPHWSPAHGWSLTELGLLVGDPNRQTGDRDASSLVPQLLSSENNSKILGRLSDRLQWRGDDELGSWLMIDNFHTGAELLDQRCNQLQAKTFIAVRFSSRV